MLLTLYNIARFYGSRLIFKDVTLAVPTASVTLLAGANGAGKSTLLKIMAGLLRPSAGRVTHKKDSLQGRTPNIAYLGHQTFLYPELTACENLLFWSSAHALRSAAKDIEDVLERVELGHFADEKAKTFSRGMAQRLNLARVFLQQPDILLLDEPGTGLDTHSTGILRREIRQAKMAGAGIVWITHNLESDLAHADFVSLLANKKLVFYGEVQRFQEWKALSACPPEKIGRPLQGGSC